MHWCLMAVGAPIPAASSNARSMSATVGGCGLHRGKAWKRQPLTTSATGTPVALAYATKRASKSGGNSRVIVISCLSSIVRGLMLRWPGPSIKALRVRYASAGRRSQVMAERPPHPYLIGEKGSGRRIALLMLFTISASDSPGVTRSFCQSGSAEKARQVLSLAARSSYASI